MSLIYGKVIGFKQYRLYCEACQAEVAIVEVDELIGLSASGVRVFCFECDGVGKDELPPIFRWEGDPYLLVVGDSKFLVDWPKSAREHKRRADMWYSAFKTTLDEIATVKSSCITLSSSPEVHKTSPLGGLDESD